MVKWHKRDSDEKMPTKKKRSTSTLSFNLYLPAPQLPHPPTLQLPDLLAPQLPDEMTLDFPLSTVTNGVLLGMRLLRNRRA